MAQRTKLKSGLYSKKIFLGRTSEGKPVQRRIKADSVAELKRIELELKNQFLDSIYPEVKTLKEAYEEYIASREHILSKSTLKSYRQYIRTSFQSLMALPISKIDKESVQKEINLMSISNSPKTIRNKYALFSSVLKTYTDTSFNVNLPMKRKPSLYIPTEEDVKNLIDAVKGTQMELPIMFAAYCGMRRGEVFALSYKDIDFKKGIVRVNKALGVRNKLKYEVKTPKTYAGYRDIDIPPVLMERILDRKKKRRDLIEITPVQFENRYHKVFRKLSCPYFRYHDLRHYYASVLVTLGIPDIYAIKLLGHSTTNFLRSNYQHTFNAKYNEYRNIIMEKLK